MTRAGLWRETFATAALIVWTMIAGYVFFVYVLIWAARLLGPFEWDPTPVQT